MLEVLIFVLIVIFVFLVIFALAYLRSSPSEEEILLRISNAREKLSIAQRRFMQNKIKRSVFDEISEGLEEARLLAELDLFRLRNADSVSVLPKVQKVLAILQKPTSHRRSKIKSILKETELLRHEMSLLESKFLKHEITQSVFEKLIAKKETVLISKEKELADVVDKGIESKKE